MLYPDIPHQHRPPTHSLLILPRQIPNLQHGPSTPFLLSYSHQYPTSLLKGDSTPISLPSGECTLGSEMSIDKSDIRARGDDDCRR